MVCDPQGRTAVGNWGQRQLTCCVFIDQVDTIKATKNNLKLSYLPAFPLVGCQGHPSDRTIWQPICHPFLPTEVAIQQHQCSHDPCGILLKQPEERDE